MRETMQRVGLLTKTLANSPVICKTLPARLRSEDKDDLVHVGEDFIELHEIDHEGRTTFLARKDDFGCRIMSAVVIGHVDSYVDHDTGIESTPVESKMGPQMLVLALETSQLVFLAARESIDGTVIPDRIDWVPMPRAKTPSRQLGKHCAVDPYSRAIAVAAREDEVMLYSTKPAEQLSHGRPWAGGFLPISSMKQILDINGSIILMDFLHPPEDDPDRVILLLLVVRNKSLFVSTINWLYSENATDAKEEGRQKIPNYGQMPKLLIPLKSRSAFLLTFGKEVVLYTDILAGIAKRTTLLYERNELPDKYSVSSNQPRWAAWMRPRRLSSGALDEDHIYFLTEDGELLYWIFQRKKPSDGLITVPLANLGCHVDSALAPFGRSDRGDLIVVTGESSDGGVWLAGVDPSSVDGSWHTSLVNKTHNWSRNFDLIATHGLHKVLPPHARNSLLAPSGRQPYGRITQLRMGIEARIGVRITDESFTSVMQTWVLPLEKQKDFLLLLSGPNYSRVISIPQMLDEVHGDTHEETTVGLDLEHSTVAAAAFHDDCILQISERGMFISSGGHKSLFFQKWPEGSKVAAAIAINGTQAFTVVSLHVNGRSELRCFEASPHEGQISIVGAGRAATVDSEIVSLAMFGTGYGSYVIAGTSEGSLLFFSLDSAGLVPVLEHTMPRNPQSPDALDACESIIVLSGESSTSSGEVQLLVLCGLRSGSIYALELDASHQGSLQFGSYRHFVLGLTAVKLAPGIDERAPFASCDTGLFNITWSGAGLKALKIFDVWITDTDDPAFCQDAVTAFTIIPHMDFSPFSDALTLISGRDCLITGVDHKPNVERRPVVVPRSLKVQGSPHLLLESSSLKCLISVATMTRLRSASTRTVQEVIEFKSHNAAWSYTHELEPGTKVYSMMEWSYKSVEDSKYHFVVIATGFMGPLPSRNSEAPSSKRGAVTLWQPVRRDKYDETIKELKRGHTKPFEEDVTAIATYGEMGFVACAGPWIYLFEFSFEERKFTEICKVKIDCPAINVTTVPPQIHVTTSRNSLVTFQLTTQNTTGATGNAAEQTVTKTLKLVGSDTKQRAGLHHITLDIPNHDTTNKEENSTHTKLNIMSTKTGDVVGLRIPHPDHRSQLNTAAPLFTAKLPRSLMRIRQARIRPPWKPTTAPGVLYDELAGISVDGTILGLALLDERLLHRLRWVQRLCERNTQFRPFARALKTTDAGVSLPPLGFDGEKGLGGTRYKPEDMYVDGDILQTLLNKGGGELLYHIMEVEAEKARDRIGVWVSENLEAQLGEVEALIEEIELVLDRWV